MDSSASQLLRMHVHFHSNPSDSDPTFSSRDIHRFVVYQGIQCYPEFLIYYERVDNDGHNIAAPHSDHARPSTTKRNDDNIPEAALSEAESLQLRIEQLNQQLSEQKTQRAAAEMKQKQLQEELSKEQEETFALESQYREPDSCTSCCRPSQPASPRLSQRYIRSDVDDFDGDWSA